ncbi:hypothetical protein DL98DRAFT_132469 [Cadophora sp. DSE1049]|nr:hypothetical protein DL98DRAFT_132469 [Cadophora sp. DSE1049]
MKYPWLWFRNIGCDNRDRALIRCRLVSWLQDGEGVVSKINHEVGSDVDIKQVLWTAEEDVRCRRLVQCAGARLIGFNYHVNRVRWARCHVTVKIQSSFNRMPFVYITGGSLSTRARNVRIFKGPADGFLNFPADVMILRDCVPTRDGISGHADVGRRKWDILCMRTCEGFENPWFVVRVRDVGPRY